MASTPFSRCDPEAWVEQCRAKIMAILKAERTWLALAQIFDGTQTQSAALGMIDIESNPSLLPLAVTSVAGEFAKTWLADQARQVEDGVDPVVREGVVHVLSLKEPGQSEMAVLTRDIVRPMIRNVIRDFTVRLPHRVDGFKFQQFARRCSSAEDAVQDWSEEYIFGGLLGDEDNMLKIKPLHVPHFKIPYEQAWNTTCLPFPFPPAVSSRSVCRSLADDPALYEYMQERKRRRDKE